MAAPKSTPKDAQVMTAILKDMGITEYEPRVINQMLEFTYRYVTTILDDARLFSSHAKKRTVDADDVRLAVQMQSDKSFTSPPPRDLLMEIARQKNSIPLPLIKANAGPRLPPDRYSLTACNYRFKSAKKPRIQVGLPPQLGLSTLQGTSGTGISKVSPALSLASKTGATLAVVTKPVSAPTVTIVSRPAMTSKAHPTPIIKLSQRPQVAMNVMPPSSAMMTNVGSPSTMTPPPVTSGTAVPCTPSSDGDALATSTATAVAAGSPQMMQPIINIKTESVDDNRKRKREDDDYDAS